MRRSDHQPTPGRYRVAAVLERNAAGAVVNEVVGDTGRRFRTLWAARREARRYSQMRQPAILPLHYTVLEKGE